MKPHGVNCQFTGFIENQNDVFTSESQFEAYIDITNNKTNEKVTIPMRSFVTNFLNALHKLFSGTGGILTKKSSVEFTGSAGKYAGLHIGTNNTLVNLSDTNLLNKIAVSNLLLSDNTVYNPYVTYENNVPVLESVIKRMFTNNTTGSLSIGEIGLFIKTLENGTYASNSNVNMLSRDVFQQPSEFIPGQITLPSYSDIMFEFKFRIQLPSNGSGGLNLNFLKLVNNLYFKGNLNNSFSPIVNYQNQAITNFSYATGASAATTSFAYLLGTNLQKYIGIVVGIYDYDEEPTTINPDEKTFLVDGNLSYGSNEMTTVTYPQTNTAQFLIQRLITNNTSNNIRISRVGLIMRGNGDGTSMNNQQAFIAINRIYPNVVLVPGQSYRAQYIFKISV